MFDILMDIQSFMERGGSVLNWIFLVTFLMWILILERFIFFRWGHPEQVKQSIEGWKQRGDKASWYAERVKEMEISLISQKLYQSLPIIKTLIALCTLLGLLGTVTGMIEVFDIMAIVGSGNARAMASGVSKATIPTMSGMVAALSGMYFSARLENQAKKKMMMVEDRFAQDGGEPCVVK